MIAYYNEIDTYAAQWLRNLISAGHIAPGDVDERSIEDVRPYDMRGYTQCHFFAGIGIWSYALRRAGWPDDRPAWTGSCPCQPFSTAGKRKGTADERHLWPAWFHLIEQCRPRVVFGEQVASPDSYAWLDIVQTDMEAAGYAFWPVVLPAAGFGAPHGRHRIYFVADSYSQEQSGRGVQRPGESEGASVGASRERPEGLRATGELGDADGQRRGREHALLRPEKTGRNAGSVSQASGTGESGAAHPTNGFWRDADWLFCRDGDWRPVEPGTFPLAHGAPARLGRLRAYGNAIVAPVAEEFVRAYMGCMPFAT